MRPPADLLTTILPVRPRASNLEPDAEPAGISLDEIGIMHDCELSSLGRDELRRWQWLLSPLREERFDLLDIGCGDGASLRVWRAWFPRARLVGLDVRRVMVPDVEDCTIVHGCQTDPDLLRALARDSRFRLVIDDGSRHADDKLRTFLTLFPWMEPDGLYLCAGLDPVSAHYPADPVSIEHGGAATPAWFAGLALTLGRDQRSGVPPAWSSVEEVRRRARGVLLYPTSVAVLS